MGRKKRTSKRVKKKKKKEKENCEKVKMRHIKLRRSSVEFGASAGARVDLSWQDSTSPPER